MAAIFDMIKRNDIEGLLEYIRVSGVGDINAKNIHGKTPAFCCELSRRLRF
jgi:hypothetical protein